LTMRLSLRKRARKLIVNSKGFSSVVGTVFMVLVMIFLSTSVFLWTLSQNTLYNQELKEKNQVELDRLNERVTASNVNYTGSDVISVQVVLENNGPLAVHITTLWVLDATINKYGFNNTLNLNLKPGDEICFACEDPVDVNIAGASATDTFNSWFVTARGNAVPLEEEQTVIVAQLAQGIGSIALNFFEFRFFTYEGDYELAAYPEGDASFTIPHSTYVAFGVSLTNLDPLKQTITLDTYTQLWLYFPAVPGHTLGPVWYIVNEVDGTIQSSYSPETINFADTKLLIFASSTPGSFDKNDRIEISDQQQKDTLGAVNLLLYGSIGSRDYGQNVPFVSLYIES
jgi:hypothetical protein